MEKLKIMWKDLSKTGKFVLAITIIIAIVVAYNAFI